MKRPDKNVKSIQEGKELLHQHFSELESLQKEEQKDREEEERDDGEATAFVPEEYHYFHPEKFLVGVNTSGQAMKDARGLIRRGEITLLEFHTGVSRDDSTQVLGQADYRINENGQLINVTITFDQTEILYSRCSDWDCYYKKMRSSGKNGKAYCRHELAAILMTREYLETQDETDATTVDAYRFMDALMQKNGIGLHNVSDLSGELLEMEPTLVEQEGGGLACTFFVGSERLYKIKNLYEFCDNMQQHKEMKFGSKTMLQLGEEYLSDSSRPWYIFLRDALENEKARIKLMMDYDAYANAQDSIALYGERLDSFLAIAVGKMVHMRRQYVKGKEDLYVREHEFRIHLTVSPFYEKKTNTLEGIRITGQIPEMFRGIKSACYVDGGYLNRISSETFDKVEPLLNASDRNGTVDLRIGRYNLADFYHKVLPELQKIAEVEEKDTGKIEKYLPPEPVFTLYLDYTDGAVVARAESSYGTRTYDMADLVLQKEGNAAADQYRDLERESAVLDKIVEYLPNFDKSLGIFFCQKNDDLIFELLDHGLEELSELCEVRMTGRFRRLGFRKHVKMNVGVSLESNLLDLSVTAEDMSEEEMLDILYQYRQKKKYVRLKNGDFVKIEDNDNLGQLIRMMDALHIPVQEITKGKMHIPAYRALYIDKMLEGQSNLYVDRDRHFRDLMKEFKTVEDADYEVPEHLKGIIRAYQKEGYLWLRTLDHNGFGGILADEMGLGKTLQVLAVIEAVHTEEKTGTSLVVCPASLVYNWAEEVKKFAPSLHAVTITGSAPERARLIDQAEQYDLLITSYDLLKRDIAEYEEHQFRFEVIDEAQYIKNYTTGNAKSVKLIHAKTKYALTGTPIENRLSELWSIFDYLMPGFLYEYEDFRRTMENPIVKNEDHEAEERLQKMIGPFILRRRKKDVLKDLPDKIEEVRYAGMEAKQRKLYDARVLRMKTDLKAQDENDFRRHKIQILTELMRIRQICCDPDLCYEDYKGGSAKKELCMDLIESLVGEGHKTLLFSQFASMLAILAKELDKRKISYYMITGQTPKEKRLELVKKFNQDETSVFLISLKAGGTGLNLTGADTVIHYDPWWNTAAENQATDRAHRIGQKNVVTVYKLVVKNTIEEKIVEMQRQKAQLAEDILSGEKIESSTFTKDDLLQILS